jgi:hypothetical protein
MSLRRTDTEFRLLWLSASSARVVGGMPVSVPSLSFLVLAFDRRYRDEIDVESVPVASH